jgi:hypothetical protein
VSNRDYPTYREAVEASFATVDAVGLIGSGAPQDEYLPEIDELLKWGRPVTIDDVIDVFLKYFGEPAGRISAEEAAALAAGIDQLRNTYEC